MGRETGFGLVEIVVSLAVFALVALPMTRIIVTTENASDTLHLRAEAVDLASQALETAQYKTQNGVNPTQGITTSTQYSGNDKFTVATDFELAPGTGTSSSICIAPPGQLSSQIWTIKATVTWGVGGQSGKVIESTLVSPSQVDLADTNAAEIAVPVYTAQDDPSQLETTASVSMTATGACASGSCGTVPGNEVTTETVNSGSTGCAVFTGLFAGAGETYTITVTPPTGYVDPLEKWWNPNTGALTFYSNVAPPPNEVDVVNNPNLILAPAAPVTVNFQTMSFSGGTDPGVTPSADIPIAVQSSGLLCPSGTTVPICVIGDGASAVTNGEGVQLFPGASVTDVQVASVTTNSTTSVTVASGGFPGVLAGWGVSGTGIPNSDTVASISGNTLTLSAAATASGVVTLTFLPPNYQAWTGDAPDSQPNNGDYGATIEPTSFQGLSGTAVTVTLPVYPLQLKVQDLSAAGSVSSLLASDSSGGDNMALIGTGSTAAGGASVYAGLPLGQYELQATGSGSNENVYIGSATPVYVWVTPTGTCDQTGTPMATCTSSGPNFTTSAITGLTVG